MNKNMEIFETAPVPKAVMTLAVPTIASMIVNVIYNMADTFFVGQTGDPNQVAAVSLATPVFLFLMAAGNIFGIGGSSFISRALGEKKPEKARSISSFCFYGAIVTGIAGGILFITCMPRILSMIGTSPYTERFSRDYLTYIAWGAPFVVVSVALSNLVRSEGAAKTAMAGMMFGTVVNIILDPIMIISMKLGVAGAAIATVIGNIASSVYFVLYIWKKSSVLSLSIKEFKVGEHIFSGVFAIGTPASLNNILMSLSNIIMNNFLSSYGDIPVASMGVAMKANMLAVFLQMGLAVGIQPLIGYNFGAKNFPRMKAVMKFAMLCNVITGTVLSVLYLCFTRPIVSIFIDNEAVIENSIRMLRALMVSVPVLGILFIFTFTFQALGKALPSLILSISRQGFVFVPVLFIANARFGLNGIVFSQSIADIVSIFIALGMFLAMNKNFRTETQ
ncbi:MAG: MATE family efflux transporter [Bacteroides sp.]|nr:MATE family efflux transporter [Prevotella sp.]MCM1407535.1 MATE family efflux transporter [Treponema brennaborense]MCM1469315.1 MATE family efflux transporter [Bacteroides sp.]